jgi:hypothetical protein
MGNLCVEIIDSEHRAKLTMPVTPIMPALLVATVVGKPYSACKHAGVIDVLHEFGTVASGITASVCPLGSEPGKEMTGPLRFLENLREC